VSHRLSNPIVHDAVHTVTHRFNVHLHKYNVGKGKTEHTNRKLSYTSMIAKYLFKESTMRIIQENKNK
jgi:hypothetical protein